ncbi:hypothetical protein GCM10009810_13670 [Nostocoides vanveenii]|uniref:Capsule synthesis protein CapA domain-containing protein n=2 Tax=Nostocoides vanveenii TaxID=330835 RepID=A0ABP4WL22_9MICO
MGPGAANTSPDHGTGTALSSDPGTSSVAPATPGDAGGAVTLAFGGDIHFEEYLRPLAGDPEGLAALKPLWGAADLRMANLETAITERGAPIGKEFHFRTPASALTTLANAGLTVLTEANNHGVDFGPDGLSDTLAARASSPIPIVGIGTGESDAYAPALLTVGGLKIAVFGADQVYEMTLANYSAGATKAGVASALPDTRIVKAVTAIRDEVDLVVVYLHWGLDYQQCPDGQSIATAKDLEAAGADVIVGAHSHRVNGAGWLGTAYVAYGLGNFVWWRSAEPDSRTGILTLTVDAAAARAARPGSRTTPVVTNATWLPLLIGRDGIPARVSPADSHRLHTVWDQARACTGLAASP